MEGGAGGQVLQEVAVEEPGDPGGGGQVQAPQGSQGGQQGGALPHLQGGQGLVSTILQPSLLVAQA